MAKSRRDFEVVPGPFHSGVRVGGRNWACISQSTRWTSLGRIRWRWLLWQQGGRAGRQNWLLGPGGWLNLWSCSLSGEPSSSSQSHPKRRGGTKVNHTEHQTDVRGTASKSTFTFSCRFSSASLSISACCLLHFSRSFFNSPSSSGAETGAGAAEASAFVEFMAEECNAAALVASASFCSTGEKKTLCECQDGLAAWPRCWITAAASETTRTRTPYHCKLHLIKTSYLKILHKTMAQD